MSHEAEASPSINNDKYVAAFFNYLNVERQLSAHTVNNYQLDLQKLIDFCQSRKLSTWPSLGLDEARLFAATLHSKGLSAKSIQRVLSAARSFYRYLLKENIVKDNPMLGVSAPKAARKLPKTIEADQVSQLLNTQPETDIDYRDMAMLELLYSSGLRVAELAGVDLHDIDTSAQTIRVIGKGNKERIVPVGRHALSAINAWMPKRNNILQEKHKLEESALFISSQGARISIRSIQTRLKYWAKKTGFDRNLHPHLLRHSFASAMLQSSGELRAVQEMLGHADISTTQIYTHLDFQHLAKVYDNAHPRAKKTLSKKSDEE